LDDRLPRRRLALEEFTHTLELVNSIPVEESRSVPTVNSILICVLLILRDIVLNKWQIIGLGEIPAEFAQTAEWFPARFRPTQTRPRIGYFEKSAKEL
jgi:hypothetical protein